MAHPLSALFDPSSVAIVGASSDPKKRGHRAISALLDSGYEGRIHPVHPAGGELLGLPVVRSVAEIDPPPDLACLYTPASTTPGLVRECAAAGIRGVIVTAVGFAESGTAGAALEGELAEIAGTGAIRVIGPNTSGVLNPRTGLNLVGARGVKPGRLAVLAQSGNIGLGLMTEASAAGHGVSLYVGVGNETDVRFDEILDFLAGDDGTAAVLLYAEGFRDGSRFATVARAVSVSTPIVVLRGGRSEQGAAAARSHTGALAGPYRVMRAVLRQAGVTVVERSDELLGVAVALASQPPVPAGQGVAVVSDGGGHAALAADALAAYGVGLVSMSPATEIRLRELLGPHAALTNPIDLAGAADRDPDVFRQLIEIVVSDPAVGGILLTGLFGGYGIRFSEELQAAEIEAADGMARAASDAGCPMVVYTLYAGVASDALARLRSRGVPVLGSLEIACRSVAALAERGRFLERERSVERAPARHPSIETAEPVTAGLAEGDPTEPAARALVAPYGVPLVPAEFCRSANEVAVAIERIDGPAAIKVVARAASHKTEAGGVALGVRGPDEGRAAYERVVASVRAWAVECGEPPDIEGVLVSPMLPAPVAELLIGVVRDADFGAVLTVGVGGVLAEALRDTAFRRLPVTRAEVGQMLDELRLAPLLNGFRGRPPIDRNAVIECSIALADAAAAHPDIGEIEINPLFVFADRAVAVDVRAYGSP